MFKYRIKLEKYHRARVRVGIGVMVLAV